MYVFIYMYVYIYVFISHVEAEAWITQNSLSFIVWRMLLR